MPEIGKLNQVSQGSVRIVNISSGEIHVMREKQNVVISSIFVDTTENWNRRITFIPTYGSVIIYSDRNVIDGVNYPGVKIADGTTYAVDLPFAGDDIANQIYASLNEHISDTNLHVTPEDRAFWNNKLNCIVEDGNLILNRY